VLRTSRQGTERFAGGDKGRREMVRYLEYVLFLDHWKGRLWNS